MNDAKITKAIINEREELVCNILVKPGDFTEEEITMLRAGKTDGYTYSFNIVGYQTGDEEKQLKEKRKELAFQMGLYEERKQMFKGEATEQLYKKYGIKSRTDLTASQLDEEIEAYRSDGLLLTN